MRPEFFDPLRPDHRVLGHVDVTEVARDVDVLAQRTPDDRDLAIHLHRHVDRLLHAVDVRGEGRDQHAAGARRDDLAERLADDPFGLGHTGLLRVGGIAEQEVDAAVPDLGQLADVGLDPVHRRVVDLVVPRVDDSSRFRLDHQRNRVGNRMGHADSFHAERADLDESILRDELAQLGRAQEAVLVELGRNELERELRRPDLGHAHLAQEVREPPDVVLVSVREDEGADAVGAILEVAEVREDEVDAEMLVARECQARVDDDDVFPQLEDGHVLADLAEPAEGNDAERRHKKSLGGGGGQQAGALQAVLHALALTRRRIDQREAETADVVAEQVHGGLDRDRVDRHVVELYSGRSSSSICLARVTSPSR